MYRTLWEAKVREKRRTCTSHDPDQGQSSHGDCAVREAVDELPRVRNRVRDADATGDEDDRSV